MRKARFTEHQIIAVLIPSKPDASLRISVEMPGSLRPGPRTTTGKRSSAAWKPLISKKDETAGLNIVCGAESRVPRPEIRY